MKNELAERKNEGKIRWGLVDFVLLDKMLSNCDINNIDNIETYREPLYLSGKLSKHGNPSNEIALCECFCSLLKFTTEERHTVRLGDIDVQLNTLIPLVQVLEFGAKKYAPNNWRKGLTASSILDSLERHWLDYINDIELDTDSGLPQVGHMLCNLMFLAHTYYNKPELWDY